MRASTAALANALSPLLEPLRGDVDSVAATYSLVDRPASAHRFQLYDHETRIGMVPSFQWVAAGLFWYLNRTVAARPTDLLLLHAAAAEREGRVVICAGRAGSGKSTLVAGLVRGGFGYLTDEITALTSSLSVAPYPKPVSLEPQSLPLLPGLRPPPIPGPVDPLAPWQVPPDSLRPGAVAAGGTLAVVVLPDVEPGARLTATRLSAADALVALMHSSFHRGAAAGPALPRLRRIADSVPCVRLRYGDLDDVHDWLLTTME